MAFGFNFEVPVALFRWAYFASAIATTGGVCCFAVLRSLTYAACAGDASQQSSSNSQGQAITATLVWAATALVANAAFLVFKPRAKQGLALAAAMCARWKTAYFLMVSIERVVVVAVMVASHVNGPGTGSCALPFYQYVRILAIELMMAVALLLFSLSAISCDYDSDFTPVMRRGAYLASAACFGFDMIFSLVWGSFGSKTDQALLSIGPFTFFLSNQIISCNASQVIVLLHLLYVSCRTRGGRGWVFASLRFELVTKHDIGTLLDETTSASRMPSQTPRSIGALQHTESDNEPAQVRSNVCSLLRHRVLQFRRQRLQSSHVFVIPCVESDNADLAIGLTTSRLQLVRPLFSSKLFPSIMLRFAEVHGNLYIVALAVVGLASLVCVLFESTSNASMVLNSIVLYAGFAFFSCRRHNIDSVAAKHVATSFRFVSLCLLLLFNFAVGVRLAFVGQRAAPLFPRRSPQTVITSGIMNFGFALSSLIDCSPSLPTIAQTAISAMWCIIFAIFIYEDFLIYLKSTQANLNTDLDCFMSLGAYSVCTLTVYVSICGTLFLLMAQALISRLFVPGVSIFVDSSILESDRQSRSAHEISSVEPSDV